MLKRRLSTLALFNGLAQIKWAFHAKAERMLKEAKRIPGALNERIANVSRRIGPIAFAALSALAITAAIAQTADFPAGLICTKSETPQTCANRYQARLEATQPGLVKRTSTGLRVRLDDGTFNVISKKCADCLDAIALHAPTRWLLIRERLPRGNTWILLRLMNGQQTRIGGFPSFAPDAKNVFVWSGLDASGDTQPTAEIFSINDGVLRSRWKGITGRQTGASGQQFYGVAEPEWLTSDSLEFVKNKWRDTEQRSAYAASRVTLTKSKADWTLVESPLQ